MVAGGPLELELVGGLELPEPMLELLCALLDELERELLDRALELLDLTLELLDGPELLDGRALELERLLLELKIELLGELDTIWLLELGPLRASTSLPSICADDDDDGGR